MKSSLKSLLGLALLGAVDLSGCDSTTVISGGGGGGGVIIDPVVYTWYDMYGNGCATSAAGPRPGCNFYYSSGYLVKIMDFEDPYFTSYYYNLVYDYWTYYLNGVLYEYDGYAWLSQTGVLYDEYGNALNQKKSGQSRDTVAKALKNEKNIVTQAGKDFAAKYSLDVNKGIEIAQALNDWAKLGKSKTKTESDLALFTQRLYGMDYSKVKSAVLEATKGNNEALRGTIAEAAKNWGTSEENMKLMLKNWYGKRVPGIE